MSYIRYNENNEEAIPQPISVANTYFGENEGWSTISSPDWNGNYQRHDENNDPTSVGTYQRHDENNSAIGIGTYQRYDENCNPIYE